MTCISGYPFTEPDTNSVISFEDFLFIGQGGHCILWKNGNILIQV